MEFVKKHGATLAVVFIGCLAALAVHQKFVAPRLAPKAKV